MAMDTIELKDIKRPVDIQAQVSSLAKQLVMVSKNLITYDASNPVFRSSFDRLHSELTDFLEQNGYLTLIVKESALLFNGVPVYQADATPNSLPFSLYKDGIRMLTFREGLERRDLMKFVTALKEARQADPYQSDLVTILWEKDLSHIGYGAVDAYIEDEEYQEIDLQPLPQRYDDLASHPNDEFLANELAITRRPGRKTRPKMPTDEQIVNLTRQILEDDLPTLGQRASTICIEILHTTADDDIFNTVAGVVSRICSMLVSNGRFIEACGILSDLRGFLIEPSLPAHRKSTIIEIIDKLGEQENIAAIVAYMTNAPDSRAEEACAYLSMLNPNALPHLCNHLAESQKRSTRYLLCRILSVIGKDQPEHFRAFLDDPRWYLVRNIAMILGMTANPKVLGMLNRLVNHNEARVRREVARSVGRIKSPEGIPILRSLAEDPDKTVRLAALTSLRQIASPAAIPILKARIADKSFAKLSDDEKAEIVRTIASMGNPGMELLMEIALAKHKHIDEKVAIVAVQTIAAIDSQEKQAILKRIQADAKGAVAAAAGRAVKAIESRGVDAT